LGILPLKDALNRAADVGLDLVEVAPNASPPVCRIMDYGKFKYEQSKKAQDARKKQAYIQIKEIKMRPRTDVHDMEVKKNRIRRFLGEGNKVKVTVRFRGREMVHKHFGFALLEKTVEEMSDIATPENRPSMEGPTMHIILAPKKD
jgi:translation initiation factor IF-3